MSKTKKNSWPLVQQGYHGHVDTSREVENSQQSLRGKGSIRSFDFNRNYEFITSTLHHNSDFVKRTQEVLSVFSHLSVPPGGPHFVFYPIAAV